VAELTANSVEGHANAEVLDRRRQWRLEIEPYTRYEVTTSVQKDGSITIATVRFRAVPTGEDGFTFTREVKQTEVHSPDEPAAAVTDRAEHLRREAAIETERQRERYRIAADAYEAVLIDREDEEQRHAAQRAASEALSSQINANLRDPPLVE
jgi:CheY-like chemotaxis protein